MRWRADKLQDEQADEHHAATRIRERVQMPVEVAADCLQRSAEPDDQRSQDDVPDDEHRVIIIAALREHLRMVERAVVAAQTRGERLDADALRFVIRLARVEDRQELPGFVGGALAQALVDSRQPDSVRSRAAWLVLFVEARHISDDERLHDEISRLSVRVRDDWIARPIADAAAALEAALLTSTLDGFGPLAAPAVDELERIVSAHYRPGQPLGSFADQVRTASALLSAFDVSGRLPYPMLAVELMQTASGRPSHAFEEQCDAAHVWCRLAVLHASAGYRDAAVVAPNADYQADAIRMLSELADEAGRRGASAAIYGFALLELESASLLQ